MKAINITAYTDDESQIEAIKAVITAFKIKFSISNIKEEESGYDPEFVKKIQQGDVDMENKKGRRVTLLELEELCK